MCKAIIYLRVSTEDQAEKGFSLQAQREECITKAKQFNCVDVIEFCDEGVSGSLLERPMLLNALEYMKQSVVDYFICYDPSRLSRNVSHQLILIDNIKKNKAKLIFAQSSYEDTAEGRFQLTIMAAVDEYERARLKIRTELGKRTKANQKLLTHNPNIYGYKFDKDTDTLFINDEQAKIVKMMYDWLLNESIGPSSIAKRLNEWSIPSMRGKQWNRVSVNRILTNYSYTGAFYIRRYDTRDYRLNKFKKKDEKIQVTQRPPEEWIRVEIPPIIEEDIWQKAKFLMDKSKRIFKAKLHEEYLLSGLLRCGICGGTIFGKTSSGNMYYCCTNKYNYDLTKENRCSSRLYKAEEVDNLIWNYVKPHLLNVSETKKLLGSGLYYKEESQNKLKNHIKELIEQTYQEREKVLMLFQKSFINEIELETKLNTLDQRLKNLTDFQYQHQAERREIINDIEIIRGSMEYYINTMPISERNKILIKLIREASITENNILLKLNIPKHLLEGM